MKRVVLFLALFGLATCGHSDSPKSVDEKRSDTQPANPAPNPVPGENGPTFGIDPNGDVWVPGPNGKHYKLHVTGYEECGDYDDDQGSGCKKLDGPPAAKGTNNGGPCLCSDPGCSMCTKPCPGCGIGGGSGSGGRGSGSGSGRPPHGPPPPAAN